MTVLESSIASKDAAKPVLIASHEGTSDNHWQRLLIKHPYREELRNSFNQHLLHQTKFDAVAAMHTHYLVYRARREERWVVAVARRLNGDGFLITAYQTDAITEGASVWLK